MNILVIGAHHDDIELGCGGSVARFSQEGHSVYGMVLTDSETHYDIRSIHRTAETARSEAFRAASVIGLILVNIDVERAKNGMLTYTTPLMRHIEQFIDDHAIEMVFCHWRSDLNTDHAAAAQISIVASRHVPSVLQYRSNWYPSASPFNGVFSIDISKTIETKRQSLACYTSEITNRKQAWIDSFIDMNRSWGFAIDHEYAEVFEPVKFELLHY